jgi:hypothetical protein
MRRANANFRERPSIVLIGCGPVAGVGCCVDWRLGTRFAPYFMPSSPM